LEAFQELGGTVREREPKRFEITRVPAVMRTRDRQIGIGEPMLSRYERICFDKGLMTIVGKPLATFVCPGHPLLDTAIDLILERYRDLLKKGAVLVDPNDDSEQVRALFYLEHSIQDGRSDRDGNRRIASRQMQFVEIDEQDQVRTAGYAPYLDYYPITDDEKKLVDTTLQSSWLSRDLEARVVEHAVERIVPRHLDEVRHRREEMVVKTIAAVKERLTKEIAYWDLRAEELKAQELAGKSNAKINSGKARQRAEELEDRLQKRLEELGLERLVSPAPPVVIGGAIVIPVGLLARLRGERVEEPATFAREKARVTRLSMQKVMEVEEKVLQRRPVDVSKDNLGYDIESAVPDEGRLFFIEVKGRAKGASTVTITKNEILTGLNKPDEFILAIVLVDGDEVHEPVYVRQPFSREPDFGVTSVNYDLAELLARGEEPA